MMFSRASGAVTPSGAFLALSTSLPNARCIRRVVEDDRIANVETCNACGYAAGNRFNFAFRFKEARVTQVGRGRLFGFARALLVRRKEIAHFVTLLEVLVRLAVPGLH